jgi:pantoate kinase
MRTKAFAPGHITGFFEILDRPSDPLRKGSRGAGLSLSLGVATTVEVFPSRTQSIDILLNRRRAPADTTLSAVREVLRDLPFGVKVRSDVQLPVGQGLGMSAAGALSVSLALSSALGRSSPLGRAGRAAHIAEVGSRTGLGDVAGALRGGWEMRVRPGLPPFGLVKRLRAPGMPVAVCVLGDPVPTKGVLSDPARRRSINRVGRACVEEMLREPTLDNFFALSHRFARLSGLASRDALLLVEEIHMRDLGRASVSMIGNTVFAVGDIAELAGFMKGHGRVFRCEVDMKGPRAVA